MTITHYRPGNQSKIFNLFQDGRKLAYGGMQGIPMIATSPGERSLSKYHRRHAFKSSILVKCPSSGTLPSNYPSISVRHEPPLGVNPVDIHGFQPPWKAFSDFALSGDPDRMDPNGPQFQHLVGQVGIITGSMPSNRRYDSSKVALLTNG